MVLEDKQKRAARIFSGQPAKSLRLRLQEILAHRREHVEQHRVGDRVGVMQRVRRDNDAVALLQHKQILADRVFDPALLDIADLIVGMAVEARFLSPLGR